MKTKPFAALALAAGNSSYTKSNDRSFDAWGGIRSGSATGNPAQRYCANLGHRADDETGGLIYMRARYYEPWTGRFVSEDPKADGKNWFVYVRNNPVNMIDASGKSASGDILRGILDAILSWISNISSANSSSSGIFGINAFLMFADSVTRTKDAVAVEAAWARFMTEWKKSAIGSIDEGGNFELFLNLSSYVYNAARVVKGEMMGMVWNLFSTVVCGAQLTVLCLGYNLRIGWYLDDI
jgi:RHS repeat-associated protein